MSRLVRSLEAGLRESNPFPYAVWALHLTVLVSVVMILIIQIEVHAPSLGTEAAESLSNVGTLLGVVLVTLALSWLADIVATAWQAHKDANTPAAEVARGE